MRIMCELCACEAGKLVLGQVGGRVGWRANGPPRDKHLAVLIEVHAYFDWFYSVLYVVSRL